MWIMLTKKLPTKPSPPKLSLFWSTAWPDAGVVENQKKRRDSTWDIIIRPDDLDPEREIENDRFVYDNFFGLEPNWAGARKIEYQGESIRVFPHEFTTPSPEHLLEYVNGSHELVPSGVAGEQAIKRALDTDQRFIYDAALCDGCNEQQAKLTALGMDITLPNTELPVIGWYRCKYEYALAFCDEHELMED